MRTIPGKDLIRLMLVVIAASLIPTSLLAQEKDEDETARDVIMEHRRKQEAEFRDKDESPLEKKDIKKFKGLNYYPINLKYRVKARFLKNDHPAPFLMKTTTTRLPEYVKYGDIYFSMDGAEYKLEVYQSQDLLNKPELKDYLFIPFTDETNGGETYDGGRFLDFKIPESEDVYLDFNLCYNPYCSYSHRYSCPIPPAENHLPLKIEAGEKKFKEEPRH